MLPYLLCAGWVLFFAFLMSDKSKMLSTIKTNKAYRNTAIVLSFIFCFLLITNPSVSALRDHLGVRYTAGIERKYNFFVCSVYTYDHDYLGIAGNFFNIKQPIDSAAKVDTTKRDTSNLTPYSNDFEPIYDTVTNSAASLYKRLIADGYTAKNINDSTVFVDSMKSYTSVKRLYEYLLKDGYTQNQLGSKIQFYQYMLTK